LAIIGVNLDGPLVRFCRPSFGLSRQDPLVLFSLAGAMTIRAQAKAIEVALPPNG
jgi:hypothetical protein